MLTPEQLKALPENVVELLQDLEDFLIYDIARRLAKQGELTDTVLHQIGRAAGIGTSIKEIEKAINKTTQAAIDDIDRTIRETIDKSIELDNVIYKKAGLRQTKKDMYNFTGSMGFTYLQGGKYLFKPITQFYQDTLDLALFQASTGAVDYKTAVRMATKKMTDNGLTFVDYASGHKNRVDVAARRAILTGVNQMNLRMTDSIMDQLGAEYVETTAHMGARPSHQIWQGRVFHMGGPKNGYLGFEEITGYGTGPGLGGWNCRHSYFAFFPGISERNYTDEQLENIDPPPFRYDGKSFSHYEATQEQRRMETDIRKTKREIAAADGLGDKDLMTAKSIKLNQQVNKYRDFSKTAKMRAKMDRTQAYPEFGRSIAQKASWTVKKEIEKYSKFHYNKDGTIVITDDWKWRGHFSVPRKYKPFAVVETKKEYKGGGSQIDRVMYDKEGYKLLELHSRHHNRPKKHPYGKNGEHSHRYVWDKKTGKRIDRITRELRDIEKKWIRDLL